MHIALILWIFSLLSTAPGLVPTKEQIGALKEGQVIQITPSVVTDSKFRYAIFLGRIERLDTVLVKVVQFATDLRTGSTPRIDFQRYFKTTWIQNDIGRFVRLQGDIDLMAHYMPPKHICIPKEQVILHKQEMDLLKSEISVVLVNSAQPLDYSDVATVGRINSLEKGQVLWVSSNIMYGGQQPHHPFHFAIFLGLANPQHGSALPEIEIAQIVMNLPLPVPHEDRRNFDAYFPTTWWKKPDFVLDGQIDIRLHKIPPGHIRIPTKKLVLDPKGVKKLEDAMATAQLIESCLSSGHSRGRRGRSSSGPADYHINSAEQFGSEDGQTPVTGLTGHCDPGRSKSEPANHHTNTE